MGLETTRTSNVLIKNNCRFLTGPLTVCHSTTQCAYQFVSWRVRVEGNF
jgi:hypothetical protein